MKKSAQENSLNLLKLFATVIIILHHFQQLTGAFFEGQINFYGGNFYWGNMVELFFILSGYFTYKYSKTLNLEEDFFSFFWKKYRRFLPLLIITGLTAGTATYWGAVIRDAEFKYTLWEFLGGMFGFGRWFSTSTIINNPTWYINVLLLCYAVFYFGTFLAKRCKINTASVYLVMMVLGILMYHVCNKYSFGMPFFSKPIGRGILCFFWGLLFRECLDKYQPHKKPAGLVLCALYLVGFIYVYINHHDFVSVNLYYILCFTVFPCVIILFKAEFLQKLCSARLFSELSNITYHTYMWHLTVAQLTINICRISETSYTTNAVMFTCLALTFVVGTVSYCLTGVITSYRKKSLAAHK